MIECEFYISGNSHITCRLAKDPREDIPTQILKAIKCLWHTHSICIPKDTPVSVIEEINARKKIIGKYTITVSTKKLIYYKHWLIKESK